MDRRRWAWIILSMMIIFIIGGAFSQPRAKGCPQTSQQVADMLGGTAPNWSRAADVTGAVAWDLDTSTTGPILINLEYGVFRGLGGIITPAYTGQDFYERPQNEGTWLCIDGRGFR